MSPRGRRAARDQASRERNARAIHTRDALEGGIAEIRRAPKDGSPDPSALWKAFVSALPHWFAPSITTVPAEGPSAEWFDRSLPRHPPRESGPGARRTRPLETFQITPRLRSFPREPATHGYHGGATRMPISCGPGRRARCGIADDPHPLM